MDPEISAILPRLIEAVQIMMSPVSSQQERLNAYEACENFKENSPYCVQCGLQMSMKGNLDIIRHFGLQLIEHCIKYRWNNLEPPDKVFIKDNAMQLMAHGIEDVLTEKAHIKDALSRITVEMIKREWPQNWPTMLSEFAQLCSMGHVQMELILLVFLRLAEDVVVFQSVPLQRRREIMQTLTSKSNMDDIFTFFLSTLEQSYRTYQNKGGISSADEQAAACQVALAVLRTLLVYVDWISMTYIFQNNSILLEMLCFMLNDEHLRLLAAECLLAITSRKVKLDERKPLMVLFSEGAMSTILGSAVSNAETGVSEEQTYLYLKRLCELLAAIGSMLCALWGSSELAEKVGQPPNFQMYLSAILAFTQHASQALSRITQSLWNSFLKHEDISQNPVFLSFIPHVIKSAKSNLLKVGFPYQDNHPSCTFSRIDHDTDEEFNLFYSKFRTDVKCVVSNIAFHCPEVTFEYVKQWLTEQLHKTIDPGPGSESGHCNLSSPSFLEWEAISTYMESVFSQYLITDKPKPGVEEGIALLKAVLNYDVKDPLILSCVMSCLSTLLIFLEYSPQLIPAVLQKIFYAVTFNLEGQTKSTRSKAVKTVRRHACSVVIKICKQYSKLLMPDFEQLYSHIRQISRDADELSQLEKCHLLEALVIMSNEFKDFNKQSGFINEILHPLKEVWTSNEMTEALSYPEKFLVYVGLDKIPVEPSTADTCGINRSHILYCINTILAVIRRSKWPEDVNEASQGGFMKELDGSMFPLNPATPHTMDCFDKVFALLGTMNALWLPGMLVRRHPEYSKAYELIESEKLNVLGIMPRHIDNSDSPTYQKPLERMQSFLTTVHDNSYLLLGNAGQCLGRQFYAADGVALSLLNSVFTNLDHIPDYRARSIIRMFMKPFVQYCPKECYSSTLFPVLATVFPYMLQRLSNKWQIINQRHANSTLVEEEEENPESQEVLDDQLTRYLTRDYLDLIGLICYSKKSADANEEAVNGMEEEATAASNNTGKEVQLSDLAQKIAKIEELFSPMVLFVFTSLTWSDTQACNKSIRLCWLTVQQFYEEKRLTAADACHLFKLVLLGLQEHGQHEAAQAMLITLALQMYELMRPSFPEIKNIFRQIPNFNTTGLEIFDEKLFSENPQKQMTEKKRKENFKKLLVDIIGKNIGEQFKKEVHIKNLPPMCVKSRPKQKSVDELEKRDMGLCALFTGNDNHL